MIPSYRFYLQPDRGTKALCHPIYGNSLALNYELEQGQRFFRAKLNGKITFVRDDYDNIMAEPFGKVFYFFIEKSTNAAGTAFSQYYKAKFAITDCTVNVDDRTITVQPQTTDQYDEVLAGLDNEYNLIQLAPVINSVDMYRRPLMQVYSVGAEELSCYMTSTDWKQDCTADNNKTRLGTTYHFGLDTLFLKVVISYSFTFSGTYTGRVVRTSYSSDDETFTGTLHSASSIYDIDVSITCNTGYYEDNWVGQMTLNNDGEPYYVAPIVGTFNSGQYRFEEVAEEVTSTFLATVTCNYMMARWITDATSVPNVTLYDIPAEDITEHNRNYHKCAMVTLGCCFQSNEVTSTPTEWGRVEGTSNYYLPPSDMTAERYLPIAQDMWSGNTSYWFGYHVAIRYLENIGDKEITLKNAYPLWSCISVLLSQFSSTTFAGTSTYSQFLYASTNPVSGDSERLFVTPKSNILNGDYTTPAQKAMTTLGKFLDMLRNVYQCYWFIDASNRLRIEHISWFKWGGSYSSTPVIGIDLTEQLVSRSLTPWAYGVNEYTYEKQDMPQRYQFDWMDDATIPFMGEAIEILSPAVTEGKVEQISIGDFVADLDYMMLNPSVFSQDGLALLAASGSGNSWEVDFYYVTLNGVQYALQNGYLAMIYLQLQYWTYDLPAKSVKINGTTYELTEVSRRKQQKVTIPLGGDDPDMQKLVKTNIGNGEIRALSVPLGSRVAEVTLNYDTE